MTARLHNKVSDHSALTYLCHKPKDFHFPQYFLHWDAQTPSNIPKSLVLGTTDLLLRMWELGHQ